VTTFCCDLDGVIWRGESPIAGSADAVDELRRAGHDVVFVTNNSSLTLAEYVAKLGRAGVAASAADLVSSAMAAAADLAATFAPATDVLVCAGDGVREALGGAGLHAIDAGAAAAVVVGWHRTFDFERLRIAADAVRAGARFVATNTDPTYPDADGVVPGAGALVAAVATAGGRPPDVIAGKPHAPMAQLVRARHGERGVMIGDRLTTDGAFAAALGWPFALVLSGISGHDPSETPTADDRPAVVGADLAAITGELLARYGAGVPR